MKVSFVSLILVCLFSNLIACRSVPPPPPIGEVNQGHWRAKALIKDKDQSRSYVVNLNFNAVRDAQARMDVTSTLGTGVASLMVDAKEVRYVLLDQKRYYIGPPQPESMRPILAMPFDPRWIHNVLFELPIRDKGWTCVIAPQGPVQSCTNAESGTEITWAARDGEKRTVQIEHAKASVQINFSAFQPKVEDRNNLFVLEPPTSFQKLRVR